MNPVQPNDLIIEVDEQIALLIEEINTQPVTSTVDFAAGLRTVVLDSILGPFGLSESMFADQQGGNITTVHNFEEGVTANSADRARYEAMVQARKPNGLRADYDDALDKAMPLGSFVPGTPDGYTGAPLSGERKSRDHLIPVSEIERSAKGQLAQTRAERVATATLDENLHWTDRSLNASKQDSDLMLWATQERQELGPTNAQHYGVDLELAKHKHDAASEAVERKQNAAVRTKQATEFAFEGGKEAGKLAVRQVVGLILKDVAAGIIDDVKQVLREGFQSLRQLIAILRARFDATVAKLKEKWRHYLAEGAAAGFAGLMSSLITLLVNSFLTTAKRVVTIIRECTLAVIRSIKLIASPPERMTGAEVAVEVLKLLSGGVVTAATLLLQESVAKAIESFPPLMPMAQEISAVLVTILGGTMGLLTVLAFDRLKTHIAFQNKALADVHRGHAIAFLKVQQTSLMLDQAAQYMTEGTARMQLQLLESWAVIEEESIRADAAISDYSHSVGKLRNLIGTNA